MNTRDFLTLLCKKSPASEDHDKKNSGCLYDRPSVMPDGLSGDR